jgi:hypothetical protein
VVVRLGLVGAPWPFLFCFLLIVGDDMSMNIVVGGYVMPVGETQYLEVKAVDPSGQVRLSDGRWLWSDLTDIETYMTPSQYWKQVMRK